MKEGTATLDEIARLIAFTKENGGIEYAVRTMNAYKQKSLWAVGLFAGFAICVALRSYLDYVVDREKIAVIDVCPKVNSTIINGPNLLFSLIALLARGGNSCLFLPANGVFRSIVFLPAQYVPHACPLVIYPIS